MSLIFYYNGIKDNKKAELQKCSYSKGGFKNDNTSISIYARDYRRFSDLVRKNFNVVNESDSMTDYFENDRIKVTIDHPLYSQVLKACEAKEKRFEKRLARRAARVL